MRWFFLLSMLSLTAFVVAGCTSTPSASPKSTPCCDSCEGQACCGDCEAGTCPCCANDACDKCEMCQNAVGDGRPIDCASCPTCSAAASKVEASDVATDASERDDGEVAVITAKGMSCPLCASNADRRLKKLPGVQWTSIDLGTGLVKVGVAPGSRPSEAELSDAIDQAGFTAGGVTWQGGEAN